MTRLFDEAFDEDDLDVVEGQLYRVLSNVDGRVLLETRGGSTAYANGAAIANLAVGDVFLLTDGQVEILAPESWPAGDRTGTIVWAGDLAVLNTPLAGTMARTTAGQVSIITI